MRQSKGKYLVSPKIVSLLGKQKSVRIALIKDYEDDPKVLLTTEQKGIVYNSLPGGKVNPSEYKNNKSIDHAFTVTLARELEEELGLPQKQFFRCVRNLVSYLDFAILTKFDKVNPLSEVVFYGLLADEVLEKLDLGGQSDTKIVSYNWVPLRKILGNFRIEDQNQFLPQGVFIFVDDHIPGILERLSEKLSSE